MTETVRLKNRDVLRAAILWAKDRLVDEMEDFIHGWSQVDSVSGPMNYAARPAADRRKFREGLKRLLDLLNLNETEPKSLTALRKAGYWTGRTDTFWEGHVVEESVFSGLAGKALLGE